MAAPFRPQSPLPSVAERARRHSRARGYLAWFMGGGLLSVALFYGALAVLRALDRLPPPPVSGTWCIDSRFAWLRRTPQWRDASLAAVGSSTTWRNLDFTVAPAEMKRAGIVNAAPCFLTINQTRFLVQYLLDRAPKTKTLLTVLTLRDLEGCSRNPTAFFDPELADEYIDGRSYAWWLYFRNFRLTDIVLHALYAGDRRPLMKYDQFGSGPLTRHPPETGHPVAPENGCFLELRRLATMLEAKGVEFIVVTLPVMQGWAQLHDADGTARARFSEGIETALASTKAILVDGMAAWSAPDSAFTDPVHLQWPETAAFTRFVWETARLRGAHLPPMQEGKRAGSDIDSWHASMQSRMMGVVGGGTFVDVSYHLAASPGPMLVRGPKRRSERPITRASPTFDAIFQNTPGHSEGYAAGVPRTYAWCSGSFKPKNNGPPPDFTAVTGWGQVYPRAGAASKTKRDAAIEIANAKTYVRLKSTRRWILLQDQAEASLAGAYFVSDFAPKPGLPMQLTPRPNGSMAITSPPEGYNAHYWITRRGTYPAGSVDAVYVQMDLRTSDPDAKLVANVGADWWRDPTAKFVQGFANNPGAGMSNWIGLSTEWSTLRFYSSSTPELLAAPPPPLAAPAADRSAAVSRRRATTPAPCVSRLYQPLPKARRL